MKNLVSKIIGITLSLLAPPIASAGVFEFSGTASFASNNYGNGNISWTRRWSSALGYHFWGASEIEVELQDIVNRTIMTGIENTTFHDQIYNINWVQSLAPERFWVIPYLKLGMGQLNREATGTYADGLAPPAVYDSWTAVAGFGLRIRLTRTFGLKTEGTSYMKAGNLGAWQDNFSVNGGFSIYF